MPRSISVHIASALSLCGACNSAGTRDAGGIGSVSAGATTDDSLAGDDSTSFPPGGKGAGGLTDGGEHGEGGGDEGGSGAQPKLDVGSGTGGDTGGGMVAPPSCKVVDDMNAVGTCSHQAPPNAFEPAVQWSWNGDGDTRNSITTPLVANLTDDNGDGQIDLCDIPDVLVVAVQSYPTYTGYIYALDGATGAVHWRSQEMVTSATPALGDLNHDGVPEIIAIGMPNGDLIGFDHNGNLLGRGDREIDGISGAVALADVDNDGAVEILAGYSLYNTVGMRLREFPDHGGDGAFYVPTAADLDGDGDLEIVLGRSAYHHDGTEVFRNGELSAGYPQIANLDDDPEPEILLQNENGISVLEHNGQIKFANLRPTNDSATYHNWSRASAVHDFDGDGVSEFATASGNHYSVYERNAMIVWSAAVLDATGVGSGTAFDFLGDGTAEAMYADETNMFVFDGTGTAVLTTPRSSRTLIEYPVVADIDNDGSAEILVVSNSGLDNVQTAPTITAIRDVQDRWIQARRIWNQHTYHVTNVREDGTIPQFEPPSWANLNTFRTNAQIENGGVCTPVPTG